MKDNSQFSLTNRKQLADLLGNQYDGLRYNAKQRFRQKVDGLREALILEYAEKKGAAKLASQIDIAREKIRQLSVDINQLGFDYDSDGDLTLSGGSSNPLDKIIDERIAKDIGTSDAIEARFDSAQLAMMTVASLEDAEKLLKSASEI